MRKQLKRQWKKLAKRSTAYFLVFAMVVSVFSVNMETGHAKEYPEVKSAGTEDSSQVFIEGGVVMEEAGKGTDADGSGSTGTGAASGDVTSETAAGTGGSGGEESGAAGSDGTETGTEGSNGQGTDGAGNAAEGTGSDGEGTDAGGNSGESTGTGTDGSGTGSDDTEPGENGSGTDEGNSTGGTENGEPADGSSDSEAPDDSAIQNPDEITQETPLDVSANDLLEEEIPPFEIMDLDAYGSMRNMLYAYALTYAEKGSLQDQINQAVKDGQSECTLDLIEDTAENLVILDDIKVTLNLNGYTLYPSVRIYNGSMSLITVYGELVLNGDGGLAPGGMEDVRGITVGDGGHLTMNGSTIKDFNVERNGAGVLVENKGTCVINGGSFTGNTAKYYGGGLFAYDAAGTTLAGGTWENNHAECGGGIAFNKASDDHFSYRNLTVRNNTASEKGGGIYTENAAKGVTLENVTVEGNTAKIGGGMYFVNSAEMNMPENGNAVIKGNHATAGSGGGIWLGQGSRFTMTAGNKITGNTADGVKGAAGGGIYLYRSSIFTMTGGEISGNHALTSGGGVAVASENNYRSSFTMSGGTVKENSLGQEDIVQTGLYGGGIYVGSYSEEVRISGEAEITANSGASQGGGVHIAGSGKGFFLEGGRIFENSVDVNNLESHGGGIYCSTVTTISDGEIYGNTAKYDGGGAKLGTVTMTGGKIYGNTCGRDGGGVRSGAFTMSDAAVICENTSSNSGGGIYSSAFTMEEGAEIYGNKSRSNGGGIAVDGFVTINGGVIYDNTASQGGGIFNWRGFRITGGSIHGNTASGRGGGIATDYGYRCYMTGGSIRDNRSAASGGGISIYRGCLEMSGGEVTGNKSTAGSGGGIYAYSIWNVWRGECGGERLKISGTAKITGNTAGNSGGGVGAEWGSVTISGGEITGNTALGTGTNTGYGGGVCAFSSVTKFEVMGGIIKDNTARRKGTDIYGTCAYRYDGNVYKERMEIAVCAANEMGGGSSDSYWMDENGTGADRVLTGSIDNGEFLKEIHVITKEDGTKGEDGASQKLSETYAYTFYEKQEGIAQVDEVLYPSVQAAVTALENSEEKAADKVITMLKDNRETVVIPAGVTVTLELDGHALKGELGSVIEVQEGAKLTVRDSSEEGTGAIREGKGKSILCYDGKTTSTFGGGMYIAGEVILENGAVKNNEATYGGGIYLSKHGALTMKDGLVTENTGRGVTVYDYRELGGSKDADARFVLLGGQISKNNGGISTYNNTASNIEILMEGGVISDHNNSGADGAGIWMSRGLFRMTGGEIRDNTANRGAIYGNAATIEITDGKIIRNRATHGSWGGGALCFENYCTCKISGDTVIEENTGVNGGALYLSNTAFTMESGKIQGNTATGNGGALWANGYSKITLAGTAVITDNHAYSFGGGVYYNTTAGDKNAWFKLSEDAAVYGNETDIHPSDLYFVANSNITELPEVEDMRTEGEDYVCWFDYRSYEPKKAADIVGKKNSVYDLAASAEILETGEIWQIRTGETDEDGEEIIKKYSSFAAAIADVRTMTPVSGRDIVIELLAEGHRESVEIPYGLKVTVDLGGHTLMPVKSDYTFYVRNGAGLTVKNGTIMPGEDMDISRGIRVAGGGDEKNVSLLAVEHVTLDGFQGSTYGGGIYATGYWGIDLDHVTIKNCSVTERGGGIYAKRSGQRYAYDFTMKNSTVTGCSAKEYGGGVSVYIENSYDNKNYGIRQITMENCKITDNRTGGIYGGGVCIETPNGGYMPLKVTITGTEISGNRAKSGGGLFIKDVRETELEDMEISHNQTFGGGGGGLYIYDSSINIPKKASLTKVNIHHNTTNGGGSGGASIASDKVTIRNSEFNDNQVLSYNDAGGLWINGGIEMYDSEICRNSAKDVGGFSISEQNSGRPVHLKNVQVRDNHAHNNYGGIYMYQPYNYNREFTFDHCEITGNTSSNGNGGGINLRYMVKNKVNLIGTVVSGNSTTGHGGGIYMDNWGANGTNLVLGQDTVIENNTAGGSGGGIFADGAYSNRHTVSISEGVSVRGNTAGGSGGGLWAKVADIEMTGGEITGNTANYGGGISLNYSGWWTENNTVWNHRNASLEMTGGKITGNEALTDGGGLHVGAGCDEGIEISGGEITGNHAVRWGGGVAQSSDATHFQLLPGGKIYDNSAGLGQDVYGNYANGKTSRLSLLPAADMFDATDESHRGIGWFDEKTSETITTEIKGKLARYYALTLLYDNGETVCMIGETPFTSVQAAVNAIQSGAVTLEEGETAEIRMVKDSVENVAIPGEMTVVLNLNGKTLRGHSTAISCQGNLTIVDEKDPGVTTTGTITGFGVEAGGGVRVLSGGHVTMKSGQISDCYGSTANTGDNSGEKGGAAVCVEAGTFVLEGGSLNHNSAPCGSAVLVRNGAGRFQMLGGVIEENTGNYGAVFVKRGTAQIAGGKIIKNTAKNNGGGVYISSGTLNIIGKKDNTVEISDNSAGERGGGIYINDGRVSLKNVDITSNRTTNAKTTDVTMSAGGGIYANVGRLDIGEGTTIMNNSAVRGGGIYQRSTSTIHMIDGVISKNTAQMGGGVAQYPNAICKFLLMGGGVYDNLSKLSASGNDFYSRYEGTDPNYGKNSVVPQLTLINAASMGNENYNAWKDDAYIKQKGEEGYQRLGELIGEGQYIIADITMSYNVDLTAAHYETEIAKTNLLTDLEVGSVTLTRSTNKGTEKTVTGERFWDSDSATKESEKTAGRMHELYPDLWVLSEETYGEDDLAYIRYTGDDAKYAGDHGNGLGLYEQNQIADWTAGNDSCGENTLVRTFDKVTYPFTVTMQKKKEAIGNIDVSGNDFHEEEEMSPDDYYRLWLEVRLPADTDKADFWTGGKDAFSSMTHYIMETELDEQGNSIRVMRGYWDLDALKPDLTPNFAEGGIWGDSITIQIYGMQDGDTIKPEFRCWMEGSEEVEKGCESDRLTVSAAAKYNVTVDYNSALSYTSYFDTQKGLEVSEKEMETNPDVVYGTMLGYGVTLELYNDNTEKGLKGIELPADGVEFDLRFKGGLYMDGEPILDENKNPVVEAPYIWAYKENENGDLGKTLDGTTYSRNMNWNDEDDITITTNYAYNAAPYNSRGGNTGCYNGGSWIMEEGVSREGITESVVHARIAGYSVNFGDANPSHAANGTQTGVIGSVLKNSYVKAFSAGYVQILFPIDEEKVTENGYLSIMMEAAVTGTKAESISHNPAVSGSMKDDLDNLKKYFGVDSLDELEEGLATGEVFYKDNYSDNQFGTYVMSGAGNADNVIKNNYFMTSTQGVLSGQEGNASTPLMSTVYIGGDMRFGSKAIRTDDEEDKEHYIRPEDFNTQTDNKVEYNYLTALNILQKFDADAYTPLGGTASVINKNYNFDSKGIGNFVISTTETATSWSNTKTKNAKLSILYAAKPNGENWEKKSVEMKGGDVDKVYDDGGVADMDSCREENLIYFATLQDLYDYFGGPENGKCVAILYELRDCCIRNGRSVTVRAGMQVSSDFELTGNTYCTTNDVRFWSNYRPVYKDYFTKYYNSKNEEERAKFDALRYTSTWENVSYGVKDGVTAYGKGLTDACYHGGVNGKGQVTSTDPGYQAYFEVEKKAPEGTEKATTLRPAFGGIYGDGYIKSQYVGGAKKAGTHNGWLSGNTLLINTLEPDINIYVADFIEGSGGASGMARKNSYNVSNGERVAKFEVEPSMGIAAGLGDHYLVSTGSLSTGISIELKLPKKLAYQKGSVRIDYSDKNCGYREGELEWSFEEKKNADGTTSLYLYTDITDIHKKLPEIFFETFIGDLNPLSDDGEVKNGETLEVKAFITPIYGKENQMAAKSSFDACKFKIVKTTESGGYITTDTPLGELGSDMIYNLHYSAKNEAVNVELVDILPYNGDGRETNFQGGYRVSRLEITFTSEEDYLDYIAENGGELRYKAEQRVPAGSDELKVRNEMRADMRDEALLSEYRSDDSGYTVVYDIEKLAESDPVLYKAMLQTDEKNSAGALYIRVPHVSVKSGFTAKAVLTPRDRDGGMIVGKNEEIQRGNNVYGDSFFYSVGGDGNTIPTGNAFIRMIGRYISGIVWMDQDNDGKYVAGTTTNPSNDRVMAGVDVELYEVTGEGDSRKYEPATDAYGNKVAPVKTDKNGRYQFENLTPGTYTAVFKNDASNDGVKDDRDYYVKKGTANVTPISFERLSLTSLDSSSVRSSNYNYAEPYYGTGKDSTDGPARLEAACLYKEISLPEAKNIQTTPYVSGNWNAGLYYIDQSIVKNWNNMTIYDQDKEYGVAFAVTGTYRNNAKDPGNEPEGGAETFNLDYTMTGKGAKPETVKVTGGKGVAEDILKEGTDKKFTTFTATATPASLSGKAETQTCTWSLNNLALQAEGRSGKIHYTVEEAKAYEKTGVLLWTEEKDLKGFITETESSGADKTTGKFTADNTQVLYDINVRKVGELINMKDIDSGLIEWQEEVRDVIQKGAKFGIYKEASCKEDQLLKEVEVPPADENMIDATGSFTSLPGGTYYIKETNPPQFYELNEAVFKLEITYPEKSADGADQGASGTEGSGGAEKNRTAVPEITLTKLAKDQVDEELTGKLTVDGKPASEPAQLKERHVLGFAVEDELVTGKIGIHKTDGEGADLAGVSFELRRQDGKEITGSSTTLIKVTGDDGRLSFEGLKPGIYILTEKNTADSADGSKNMLPGEPVTVTLPLQMSRAEAEGKGLATAGPGVRVYDDKCYYYEAYYEISNEAVLLLPETGGKAGMVPVIAALLILFAGGYLLIRRRKKGNA